MSRCRRNSLTLMAIGALGCVSAAMANPFITGATGAVDFGLSIATPIAILLVMVLGGSALAGKLSWGWVVGAVIGIAIIFGSSQIVEWIRGMFGV